MLYENGRERSGFRALCLFYLFYTTLDFALGVKAILAADDIASKGVMCGLMVTLRYTFAFSVTSRSISASCTHASF